AARGFLNWSQLELAQKVRVGKTAICDFERGKTTPHKKTLEDIGTVFEDAGIEFLDEGKIEGFKGPKVNR
ncbi:MAG: ribosome-binding protein aMBF1 (putative translation factor), partial [Rickettsiales bacterium]